MCNMRAAVPAEVEVEVRWQQLSASPSAPDRNFTASPSCCRLHFTAARALSAFSLDQYCHLLGLLTMASLLLLTAWLTLHPTPAAAKHHTADDEPAHPHQVSSSSASPAAVWLAGIVLVVLLLSGVAIAQVVARLWLHQSQAVLAEDEVLV
jgi:hypothetical protein